MNIQIGQKEKSIQKILRDDMGAIDDSRAFTMRTVKH